ncbi:MAG: PQQ-binding-like beta-propeller repeat protein [Thermoguttaceae bacterium]|jgi:outer membrane protein assembly factor BamB|nr:PQQ-binding-like beta-propeller repeat protein [Thermoguttaceae bacterium]
MPSITRLTLLPFLALLLGADWPTFQGDYRRSGTTAENVAGPLAEAWRYRARHAPAPAWPEPAQEDVTNRYRNLRAVVAYDRACQIVVAGGAVYFGSSADDKVYALQAATGKELWSFFTGGPVRLAPTVADGLVYAGSDDGAVYCLRAVDGQLVWKRHVQEPVACVPGNGRMISLWPVRSSIVVDGGVAYAAAGLFPNEGVYLAAIDAKDGMVQWNRKIEVSTQGYMLASEDRLYVPTGRTTPAMFARADGKFLGSLPDGGGACVLLDEREVASGPGVRPPGMAVADAQSRESVATFNGLRMVVGSSMAYLQSEDSLMALDRATYLALAREAKRLAEEQKRLSGAADKPNAEAGAADRLGAIQARLKEIAAARKACYRWSVPCDCPFAMILAGRTLFLGGEDKVIAVDPADGKTIWSTAVSGTVHGLAAADGRLFASTDQGIIHCFQPVEKPETFESAPAPEPAAQPASRPAPDAVHPADDRHGELAQKILGETGIRQGYCVVLGSGKGRLACELARRSDLQVVAIEPNSEQVAAARHMLDEAGFQGTRATVMQAAFDRLPLPDYCANLVVSGDVLDSGRLPPSAAEVERILRPNGGMAVLVAADDKADVPAWNTWGEDTLPAWQVESARGWVVASARREALAGAGEWTHAYADPANTASSGDRLVGSPMRVQWFGRPGPRPMVDRHFRNVPPLCKDGRLFVPGREIVFAVDVYNGTIYWEAEIPDSLRVGAFLDSNSMAVDEKYLYLAAADQCVRLSVVDGRRDVLARIASNAGDGTPGQWGYLALAGSLLLGSERSSEAAYREITREAELDTMPVWYPNMRVALSNRLFSLDRESGKPQWSYRNGRIVDTTLTVGGATLCFLESRNPAAMADRSGRMTMRQLIDGDQMFLVALDVTSGKSRFEQRVDMRNLQQPVYLGFAEDTLLLSGSTIAGGEHIVASGTAALAQRRGTERVHYYFQAFDAGTGRLRWQRDHDTDLEVRGGHGEFNRHPTLIGPIAYTWPYAYELRTGQRVEGWKFDRRGHGCGAISASAQCLFWRGGNPWMYDLRPGGGPVRLNQVTRPGCFINIIPAGGLVLIPEASSGCTCAYPMQMSIAYAPR